jgi:nucleoside-diphosphate-sugar epimerase
MRKPVIGIIGGSGYIGSRIAERLVKKYEVRVLDKNPFQSRKITSIQYQHCDITRYENVKRSLEGVDAVIHTAIVQIPLINDNIKQGFEVNFIGTQNVCKAISEIRSIKGMVLAGSWHVFGEKDLEGKIDENFGFRPDKVEDRAYLYVLSKIAQEVMVRFYSRIIPDSVFGIIRLGTVLGEGMPEKTAANIFISRGLKGEPITPYKHSMYRPMFYVDINDACRAFEVYIKKVLRNEIDKERCDVINVCWPTPVTILDLAKIVQKEIVRLTKGRIMPPIKIIDQRIPILHDPGNAKRLRMDISRAEKFLGLKKLKSPKKSIANIIGSRLKSLQNFS